ncbi:phage protease [Paracoccus denitrificans]|uniref:phage protease n=1 Tax=Paracoccus denitrificans TaxID=266 RepID=UPI0033651AAE
MTRALSIALMAAQSLPEDVSAAPEWIHLLPPSGKPIATRDGRGPYRFHDAESLMAASLAEFDRLPLDENHATDIAAPLGQSAPARGWIVALQAREDGIWGKVEWTPAGRELIETHAYRYISPVIGHSADGRINRILRASLVNRPNMRGLTALHQEGAMPLKDRLAELVGLNAEASDDDIVAAVTGLKKTESGETVALQSQLAEIGTALGVTDGDHAAILAAAQTATKSGNAEITALQSELTNTTKELNTLRNTVSRDKATAFVDAHLNRAGVKPLRDHYITRHMADPEAVEKELKAFPVINGAVTTSANPPEEVTTHAEDPAQLASRATAYQKKLADGGQNITYATAVRAVQEGKDKA